MLAFRASSVARRLDDEVPLDFLVNPAYRSVMLNAAKLDLDMGSYKLVRTVLGYDKPDLRPDFLCDQGHRARLRTASLVR